MTYAEAVQKFLGKVMQIYNSNPKRREPGDGSDGYCDCIGLPIGASRRAGFGYTGIHGSNFAARKQTVDLKPINSQGDLQLGDVVYKAVPKGHANWSLPKRYWQGGQYYNGDLNDYYHAGVVESLEPLRIRHMSSKMTTDTKVNTYYPWTHHGKFRPVVNGAGGQVDPDPGPTPGTKSAIVVAEKGGTVNLREKPSKNSRILKQVKLGNQVEVTSVGETWCGVKYGSVAGYMMTQFLDIIGDGKGKY